VERREARSGTLVLGGGFAGNYVARLLGKRGSTIVSPENYSLFGSSHPVTGYHPKPTQGWPPVANIEFAGNRESGDVPGDASGT
jgi:hypothetical protein